MIAQSYAAGALSRRVLRALGDTPVIVDEHNVESAYYRRALADLRAGALGNLRQWLAMRRFERVLWRRAAGVTTVTEGDAAIVREVTRARVRVVPNGVALSSYRYIAPSARTSLGVLFVGSAVNICN